MSIDSAEKFYSAMKTDPSLREKMMEAEDDAVRTAVIKDLGFDFTKEELIEVRSQTDDGELSDEALEQVAGGGYLFSGGDKAGCW